MTAFLLAFLVAALAPVAAGATSAPPAPVAASAEPPAWGEARIQGVELRLPPGADVERVKALLPVRPGQQLSRRGLRRAVRLLYETGQFRQVRAHVAAEDGGARVTFVFEPRLTLGAVRFPGASTLRTETLAQAAGLQLEEGYEPEMLRQAVEGLTAAYARVGHLAPSIRPRARQSADGRVEVAFQIDEGPRSRIGEIVLEGVDGWRAAALRDAMLLPAGRPLDVSEVDAALDRLRAFLRQHGRLRAHVGQPAMEQMGGRAVRIRVPLEPGPRVRLQVVGNTLFSDAAILELLALEDEPVTVAAVEDAAPRVLRRYRLWGRSGAAVHVEEKALGRDLRGLRIRIDEGRPLSVEQVTFPGAQAFGEADLARRLCDAVKEARPDGGGRVDPAVLESLGNHRPDGRTSSGVSRPPDPCSVWDRLTWRAALRDIAEAYRAAGHLSVRVGEPELHFDDARGTVTARIPIEEGLRTTLAGVAFEGVDEAWRARLRRAVSLRAGMPLSGGQVDAGRLAVRTALAEAGHPFAEVRESLHFEDDGALAHLTYRVDPGPEVRVGRVLVRGTRNAEPALVSERLALATGDTWVPERVRRSQQNILRLGIFRSAAIRLLEPEEPAPVMDVLVNVSERKPQAVELGFGVSTEDGPRAFAQYTHLLVAGSAELDARAKANYPLFAFGPGRLLAPGLEWETHLGLRLPRFLDARTDLVWERDNRPAYGLTRIAAGVGSDARLTRWLAGSLQLEVEFDDLTKGRLEDLSGVVLTQREREQLRLEEGQWLMASLRPGLTIDLRDDPFTPSRGWLVSAVLDWSRDLGIRVAPLHLLKATGTVSRYQPLPGRTVLAVSAQGGAVFPLREDNLTIGPKRFFLGGADSLRGFPIDAVLPEDQRRSLHADAAFCESVLDKSLCSEDARRIVLEGNRPTGAGGEAFVLLKSELRIPLAGALEGGLFLDVGNLWRDAGAIEPFSLRSTAGVGLRYQTPVGPLALDVGFNLDPDEALREDAYAVHFAIGLF